MDIIRNMTEHFARLRRILSKKRKVVMVLACVVVFVTTYALILPAITMDKDSAKDKTGMSIKTEQEDVSKDADTPAVSDDSKSTGDVKDQPGISEQDQNKEDAEVTPQEKTDKEVTSEKASEEKDSVSAGSENKDAAAAKAEKTGSDKEKNDNEKKVAAQDLQFKGNDFKVVVKCDEKAGLPEGTKLKVKEIKIGSKEYEKYKKDSAKKLKADNVVFARFFDIELTDKEGKEIEPADAVDVKIEYDDPHKIVNKKDLSIVHFKEEGSKEKPEIIDEVKVKKQEEAAVEISYKQNSFSVTGTIVTPISGGSDLEGRPFTISNGSRYATAEITRIDNNTYVNGLGKTTSHSRAAEWYFEHPEGSSGNAYYIYTMVNGEKKYLNLKKNYNYNSNRADADLTGDPQVFTVIKNNNTYQLTAVSDGTTYYLDEHNGSNGNAFAGWYENYYSQNGNLTLTTVTSKNYAIVVEYTNGNNEKEYYVVENDGTLTRIENKDVTKDDSGAVTSVQMNNPIFWKYTVDGENCEIWHNTDALTYQSVGLSTSYVRRYIDAGDPQGYSDHREINGGNGAVTNLPLGEAKVKYNNDSHKISNVEQSSYFGIEVSDGVPVRICGNSDAGNAATVYFAESLEVPDFTEALTSTANAQENIRNHIVNHIDISVMGKAGLKFPLAYGHYTAKEVDENGEIVLNGATDEFSVSEDNDVTIDVEQDVNITEQDLRKADLKTYIVNDQGEKVPLNNAYYVTGYSKNDSSTEQAGNDTDQIRLEGSFKVSNMPRVSDNLDPNDENVCRQRLANRIYYELSFERNIDFKLIYTKEVNGVEKRFVILKENGDPFSVNADVSLMRSFNFWDQNNECPGVRAIYSATEWQKGKIPDNTSWNNSDGHGGDGGPGMDFRLGGELNESDHKTVAIEVTKYVQSDDGTVKTLSLKNETNCRVNVYQKNGNQNEKKIHDKTIKVGTDGIGKIYDYEVTAGTFQDQKYYNVKEDAKTVDDSVIDSNDKCWIYDRSRLETEYVWRSNDHPKKHYTPENGAYNKNQDEFAGYPEVLGEYYSEVDFEHTGSNQYGQHYTYYNKDAFNRFLEFYVYNIYVPGGILKITKNVTYNGEAVVIPGEDASDEERNQAIERASKLAGTYTFTIYNKETCKPEDKVKDVQIEIKNDGKPVTSGEIELPVGNYWIKETGSTNTESGMELDDRIIPVTISQDNTSETPVIESFTNNYSYSDTEVSIVKIDQSTREDAKPKLLQNAKFQLSKTSNSEAPFVYTAVGEEVTTGESGTVSFEHITNGRYKIEETAVPVGYTKQSDNTIYFKAHNGNIIWTDSNYNALSDQSEKPYGVTLSDNTFTVGNEPGASLPSTGGVGTAVFYIFGGLLITMAAGFTFVRRRRIW